MSDLIGDSVAHQDNFTVQNTTGYAGPTSIQANSTHVWPYVTPGISTGTVWYGNVASLSDTGKDQVREIIQDELRKALHPETDLPSVTVEAISEGHRYRGVLYLVEEQEDTNE